MVPRISRCMKALKWKRSLGAGRSSPRKVAAKAWASALIITASSIEIQKEPTVSTARFWGSRIKGTGQAVSKDITLTLVLLNNREGRNSSLPSQFTRLVGKNYPIKGFRLSYFSCSNMHRSLGHPGDHHRYDQHDGGEDEGPGQGAGDVL